MKEPNPKVTAAILECHITEHELNLLMEEVCEGKPTPDQVANIISGIMELNRLRVEKVEREYTFTIEHPEVG